MPYNVVEMVVMDEMKMTKMIMLMMMTMTTTTMMMAIMKKKLNMQISIKIGIQKKGATCIWFQNSPELMPL